MKTLHEALLDKLLSFKPLIKEVTYAEFCEWYEDYSINYITNEIEIQVCEEHFHRCYVDVESIVKGFELNGKWIDAYGSIIVGNELLLNNYGSNFYEDDRCVNIVGFVTINKDGKVRFSQIVYSFKFNRMIIRDDVTYMLPFEPNLEEDFGGKRGTYRNGSILSIRTTMDVYNKVDKKYHQSDLRKDDLSYPRLELR